MDYWLAYSLFRWVLRLGLVLVIIRRGFPPAVSLAWIAVIFALPELGLVGYLLVGESRLARQRVRHYQRVLARLRAGGGAERRRAMQSDYVSRPRLDAVQAPVMLQAERISGMPILDGNQAELLTTSAQIIDRLVADIDAAQHHVHLLFYIFEPDATGQRVVEALARARGRGVSCRVLADAAGSRRLFGRGAAALRQAMAAGGVELHMGLPVRTLRRRLARLDLRNHRKLAIIDGRVAYTGSRNIVDDQYGHRRAGRFVDIMARLRGPVVAQLQLVFLDDWYFDTQQELAGADLFPAPDLFGPDEGIAAQAVPTGPSQETESLVRVILAALSAARQRVIITSPYLVPDEPTMLALVMAADRGVEVTLVVPDVTDHPLVSCAGRAYYQQLLEARVGIFAFHQGMLHSKIITVDDTFALLGSSNLDVRSFYLNFELNVLLYGEPIARALRAVQTQYMRQSTPLELDRWRRRPTWKQYRDNAAALLSPLL